MCIVHQLISAKHVTFPHTGPTLSTLLTTKPITPAVDPTLCPFSAPRTHRLWPSHVSPGLRQDVHPQGQPEGAPASTCRPGAPQEVLHVSVLRETVLRLHAATGDWKRQLLGYGDGYRVCMDVLFRCVLFIYQPYNTAGQWLVLGKVYK